MPQSQKQKRKAWQASKLNQYQLQQFFDEPKAHKRRTRKRCFGTAHGRARIGWRTVRSTADRALARDWWVLLRSTGGGSGFRVVLGAVVVSDGW